SPARFTLSIAATTSSPCRIPRRCGLMPPRTSDVQGRTMNNPICLETGVSMRRGVRPMVLEYKGVRTTFDMPGWYCDACAESIHTGEDMKMSDRALNRLKA